MARASSAPSSPRSAGITVVPDPLRALFDSHYDAMVRLATALLGHNATAEDVVQQALLDTDRAMERLGGLDPGAQVAYLRKAVLNGCRSQVRAVNALKRTPVAVREGEPTMPEDVVVNDEQHRRMLGAIDRLPERQRQCLVLRYYVGLHDTEVAEALGLSVGSAKTHLRRGLQALQHRLGGVA